jgi:hypothetical protein
VTAELPVGLLREGFAVLATVGGRSSERCSAWGSSSGSSRRRHRSTIPPSDSCPASSPVIVVAWVAGGWAMERLAGYLGLAFQRMSQHL